MSEEKEVQEVPVQEEQIQLQVEAQEETKSSQRDVDKNWDQVHQVLKLQKQEIEELRSKVAQQVTKPAEPEKDEFDELDPDDNLTVSQAKKLAEKMAEKKAMQFSKQAVQEYAQQQSIIQSEERARARFQDYDYVIENYALPMIKNDPALAYQIQNSKNPAETAYKLGKLSDSYEENMSKQQTSPKADKILKNTSRPVSSNAVTTSLKGQADEFAKLDPRNPADAQKIYEMSQRYARQA